MVTLLVSVELHVIGHELLLGDLLENNEFRLILATVVVITRRGIRVGSAVEEALVAAMRTRHRRIDSPVGDSGRAVD